MSVSRCALVPSGHDDYLERESCLSCVSDPFTSVVDRLLRGMSTGVFNEIAADPDSPEEVLRYLLLGEEGGYARVVSANPNVPSDALTDFLPYKGDWDVIYQRLVYSNLAPAYLNAASNPRLCEGDMRFLLARGGKFAVEVAKNPSVNDRISILIMHHGQRDAKIALVKNPHAPDWTRSDAVDSDDSLLVAAVASNESTSGEVLSGLLRGSNFLVSLTALENPSTPDDAIIEVVRERVGEKRWASGFADHMDSKRSYPDEAIIPVVTSEHVEHASLSSLVLNNCVSDKVAVIAYDRLVSESPAKMGSQVLQAKQKLTRRIRKRFRLNTKLYPAAERTLVDTLAEHDWWEWDENSDEFLALEMMQPALET